jgi:cobalt-zinc-cadmium efflux system protein
VADSTSTKPSHGEPSHGPGCDHGHAGHDHGHAGHDHGHAGHDHGHAGHDHGHAGHDHGHAGHDHGPIHLEHGPLPTDGHTHEPVDARGYSAAEAKQVRRLKWVLGTVSTFFVWELVGARLAKSAVLEADALHLLMDVFALGMSLFAMRLATRPPTSRFTFGLRRAEPLAALLNAGLILLATVEIVHESIGHLRGEEDPKGSIMLVVAVMALFVNGVSAWLLHGAMGHAHHGHDHGHDHDHHDHDHGHDHGKGKRARVAHAKGHQLNLRGAWLHLMGDILGSVAALFAALVVKLGGPSWVDPLASFLVVLILVVGAVRLIRDALFVLLESVPKHLPVDELRAALLEVENVKSVEDLHVWTLGAGQDAVMARVITHEADAHAGKRASDHLRDTFDLAWVAVQADPPRA